MPETDGNQVRTESDEIARLYREAWDRYGGRALWNLRQYENPTPQQALGITRQLRIEGDMNARRLAERIEEAVRAYL